MPIFKIRDVSLLTEICVILDDLLRLKNLEKKLGIKFSHRAKIKTFIPEWSTSGTVLRMIVALEECGKHFQRKLGLVNISYQLTHIVLYYFLF